MGGAGSCQLGPRAEKSGDTTWISTAAWRAGGLAEDGAGHTMTAGLTPTNVSNDSPA